jgi:signal transduction histidine kinase
MKINPLLLRQLKKCGIDFSDSGNIPESYLKLINLINESYFDFDEDKMLLERSIDISSREYAEHIKKIKELQSSLIQNEKLAGIGQLSAGVAHEINNPLGFVRSNMETLSKYILRIQEIYNLFEKYKNSEDNDIRNSILLEMDEYCKKNKTKAIYSDLTNLIDETLEGISRISIIVKSLLSFSRNGDINELEDFDMNKAISDTLIIAQNEIKYIASVKCELGEIPVVKAKPSEIFQVLLNIIINAVYAIKAKDVMGEIEIKTFLENNYVHCTIKDNGGGISPEAVNKIFEPFFTTKPVGKGTGLGLSISYDIIVNKHKGNLIVDSHLGEGTVFTVSLPTKLHNI